MRISKFVFLLAISLMPASLSLAQSRTELMREVEHLSSPSFEGRGFGTRGASSCSDYILSHFRYVGLNASIQSFVNADKVGYNVIGITPGQYEKYIVVGAYLDGPGLFENTVYPGADANASGLSALLYLAKVLPASCTAKVGLIFVAFDGHLAGLYGSKVFVEEYLDQYPIALMVNMELIGSSLEPLTPGNEAYIIALGGDKYKLSLDWAVFGTGMELSTSYYGSKNFTELFYKKVGDQRWFVEKGIPSVMFTSGITTHTNKPTDIPSNLNPDILTLRVKIIREWIEDMIRYGRFS